MAGEESHLLVTEKSVHMKRCQFQKSSDDVERNCTKTQVYYDQPFWTNVAFLLFTLTFISGAMQFSVPRSWFSSSVVGVTHKVLLINSYPVSRRSQSWSVDESVRHRRYVALPINSHQVSSRRLTETKRLSDSAEADTSKSMYFNIIGFEDFGTRQNPGPRELYKSVGQTVVRDGKAYLTSQVTTDDNGVVPKPHSVGRLMHPRPFRVKHRGVHRGEQRVVSFHTTFVFSIKNLVKDREATGDGFAFLMVPQDNVLGSGGGYLGVMNSTDVANTFAVEFDIWQNPVLRDISNNHVGINVNSMVSVIASDAGFWSQDGGTNDPERFNPVDLTSGKIQAWIDYDGISQELTVSISPELGSKPPKPLLSKHLDLSKVFRKYMYAGFSAATGEFSAKHIIHNWKFEKHVNSRSGGFTAPKILYPSASRSRPDHSSARSHPLTSKGCSDMIRKLCSTFYLSFRDFSKGFFSEGKELLQLWPYVLLGFLVGLPLMQITVCLYQTCVACCFGPVECYESTRELQELAEADNHGRFILVLSDREVQQHPSLCSVV